KIRLDQVERDAGGEQGPLRRLCWKTCAQPGVAQELALEQRPARKVLVALDQVVRARKIGGVIPVSQRAPREQETHSGKMEAILQQAKARRQDRIRLGKELRSAQPVASRRIASQCGERLAAVAAPRAAAELVERARDEK